MSLLKPCITFLITAILGSTMALGQANETAKSDDRPAVDAAKLKSKIKTIAQSYIDSGVAQSIALGVIEGDQEFVLGVGQISNSNEQAPDGDSVFEIGSITKVFTGILLADAIERGLVNADQPAEDLLPKGIKMPVWTKKPERKITLTDLSTHSSGLPSLPDNLHFQSMENPYAKYRSKDMYEFLDDYELTREPGTHQEYSNLAVGLLGELIAQKQDQTYEELMLQRIAKPLKMDDTSITLSAEQRKRLATPHDDQLKPTSTWEVPAFPGCGGIRSTANDMLKFARASLDPPDREEKHSIGKAFEIAWSEQRPAKIKNLSAMGLGWFIDETGTHMHDGGTGGTRSILLVDRKHNRALIALCNTATPELNTLGSDVMAMLAGKDIKPRREEVEVTEEICASYIGKYQLDLNKKVFIDVAYVKDSKTKLTVQMTRQTPLRIYPESDTKWFLRVVKAAVKFEVDEKGKCTGLTLIQNGKQRAKKVN